MVMRLSVGFPKMNLNQIFDLVNGKFPFTVRNKLEGEYEIIARVEMPNDGYSYKCLKYGIEYFNRNDYYNEWELVSISDESVNAPEIISYL